MTILETDLVVLGSGPGGYAAAFRAADLGLNVVLVEKYDSLGGVCLNVGCIPSKSLLHIAETINANKEMAELGIDLGGKQKFATAEVLSWKNSIIKKLTQGLGSLAKMRKVKVVQGVAKFSSSHEVSISGCSDGTDIIKFKQAVIAVGSEPIKLPFIPDDKRIFDSTGALELNNPSGKMLVLGGGIIGCEMATVYNAFGAEVIIVELLDQLMPGADKDIVAPCHKILEKRGIKVMTKTKVVAVEAKSDNLIVEIETASGTKETIVCEQVLTSVGRRPNGAFIAAEQAGVNVDSKGFIAVDKYLRTNIAHIYAIGDVIGQPMLAHKATAEGRKVAEIIAGKKVFFDARCIPSVAYTDPEVAWVGVTENEARELGLNYKKAVFPWMACGRSLCQGRDEGLTKIIAEKDSGRVLGAAIVGRFAGDLIAEFALAIEMGANVEDIALTIHPHPSLSETSMLAAEMWERTITDLLPPKE